MMKYDVPLPRVLDGNGNELRRLNVIDASVSLSLVPLSTAQITIPLFEELNMRDWVAMYTSQGFAGVFRVRSPSQNYRQESKQYSLDHGIVALSDYIIKGEVEYNGPATNVITAVFNHYLGSMWQLGVIEATETVEYSGSYDDVLTAMMGIMDQLPDYMMKFNQSVFPWVVSVVRKPQVVTGEGRLSRNVISARISEDDSNLCTRIINSNLPNGKLDADTIGQYGIVERFIDKGDDQTQERFLAECQKYLNQHKKPLLSVNLELYDLEQITGETIDNITVGDLYRLALPDYNTNIEQPVIALSWRNVYGDPGAVSVTLANEELTMSSAFHTITGSTGSSLDGEDSLAKANKNIKVVREEVKLKADQTYISGLERRVDHAEITIDAQGVEIIANRQSVNVLSQRVTTTEATLEVHNDEIVARATKTEVTVLGNLVEQNTAELRVQSDRITAEVQRATATEGTMLSRITQTSDAITSEVTRASEAEGQLGSRITQTANSISFRVNSNEVTIDSLQTRMSNLVTGTTEANSLKSSLVVGTTVTARNTFVYRNNTLTIQSVNINGQTYNLLGYRG